MITRLLFFSLVACSLLSFYPVRSDNHSSHSCNTQTDTCSCPTIVDYLIVMSPHINGVYFAVKDSIKNGWQPIGGISMDSLFDNNTNRSTLQVVQVMVKYKTK